MKTKTTSVLFLTSILAGCAAGPTSVRFSAGVGASRIQAEDDEGTRASEHGPALLGRVEVSQPSKDFPDVEVGLYAEVGAVDYVATEDSDLQQSHASAGAVIRGYLSHGALRPFAEVRGGYRHSWLESFGDERGGPGYELGAAAGLQLQLTQRFALFGAVDYTAAGAQFGGLEFDERGPALMFGGTVRF